MSLMALSALLVRAILRMRLEGQPVICGLILSPATCCELSVGNQKLYYLGEGEELLVSPEDSGVEILVVAGSLP
ncbi:hypothetical protein GE09DRAFT_126053 [Coniochaeta sp. 2T2.1]|nr:hypothetical protein GE09DRAFT_126053 [Coniochaeta sp. 2T2.1]